MADDNLSDENVNIFPGSIQLFSVSKFLLANCNHKTFDYIPTRDLWLNRLYFEISNSREKICPTINCRNLNSPIPAKYKTRADNNTE